MREQLLNGNAVISERTISMKNSSLERPPVDISLKSELDLEKYDAKERSRKEKKKSKKDTSSKELETAQNNDVLSGLQEKEKEKRKKQKKRHDALEDNVINNIQEGTLLKNNSSLERDSRLQPPVNICCKMDSVTEFNAGVSLSQEKDKGKENNQSYYFESTADMSVSKEKSKGKKHRKRYSALESNDIDLDIQEAGDRPSPDLTSNKHIRKEDLNSVSDVVELEATRLKKNYEVPRVNSLVAESSDACSIKKHDDYAEVYDSPEDMRTYRRKNGVRTNRRKSKNVSCSSGNSLESIKEDGTSSSMQAVQSSLTREISFPCSGEGTTVQVVEDISMEEASVNCLEGKPAAEERRKKMKVKNVKETGNEDDFMKDVSVLNVAEGHFEQANRGELDKIQIAIQDGSHVEEILDDSTLCCKEKASDGPSGCDPSRKHLEQKNVEIQTKMEEIISSSLNLGPVKDDVDPVVMKDEDNSLQVSRSSPERALIGCSKKKLLILDVNGLLADIVPYVPDGYKPDITISKKAVFKRPFCEEFLQFCFERFDVGVWSSRTKRNVDRVLDFLMGDSKRNLLFCWDQFHCTDTGFNTIENRDKPLVLKELKKLWEKHKPDLPWEKGQYNESNTLLLDDSPYKALRNPAHTAIFPHTYRYKDIKDCSLGPTGDLRVYLEGLAAAENVQSYVKQYPFGQRAITESNLSWGFYSRIIGTDSDQPKDDASNSSTCG